jgi:ATP-dependent RNA helicase RhlE
LKRIVALVPPKRQTLFFSATMPRAIKELADRYLTNPAEVSVAPVATTVERVEQFVTFVNQAEKQALLIRLLKTAPVERALVFSRTKHGADKIIRMLGAAGIDANAIHGNKSQPQRERAIALFRSGEVKVLVATDIAARGIDIPSVSHVFNYDLPHVPDQYVHRIGRTARAGASGIAIAFCSDEERPLLRDIERLTRQKLNVEALPADFALAIRETRNLKPAPIVREQRNFRGPARPQGQRPQGQRPQGQRPSGDHRPNRNPTHRGAGGRPGGGNRGRPGGPRRAQG